MESATANADPLRRLIRELITELAPGLPSAAPAAADRMEPEAPPEEVVSVTTDTELAALVHRIARLCDDPATRHGMQAGQIRFRLAATPEDSDTTPAVGPVEHRITKQLVTERDVAAAHQAGATLVLTRRTVVTPLARDKAKALRVNIERDC